MPKTKKLICVLLACLLIFPLTFINAFALEYKVDDVTLDIYSSYFWDAVNGSSPVAPYLINSNNKEYLRFETTLDEIYYHTNLYVFANVVEKSSKYCEFTIKGSINRGGLYIDSENSGIYTISEEYGLGEKIGDLKLINSSSTLATMTFKGELPDDFIIFLDYHFGANDDVSVSYFDLSFDPMSEPEIEQHLSQSQGNSAVNSLTNIIPNDSQGFIDGFQRLTAAMTYEGIDSTWTFPALYIPAINGLFNKIELSPEREIDFGYWCKQIPSTLLTLIQYISTIALILYCFYELYDTISYALTLGRKGSGK